MAHEAIRASRRDIEGLLFIGRGYEVAQYQLHAAVFAGRAATVVSRFVRRWAMQKMITAERLNRTGVNRLRLTTSGRDFLGTLGCRAADLFAPRRPTAYKDLAHVLWINDLRVAVGELSPPPQIALPAWTLQRRLGPAAAVIPDLLCIWQPDEALRGGALACEVDLGGESIRGVLQSKLERLRVQLREWAGDSPSLGVVLTTTNRRAVAIEKYTPGGEPAMVVVPLPSEEGERRFEALRDLIQRNIISFIQKPAITGMAETAIIRET